MQTWKRLLATSFALGAGSLAACGDDGGTSPDARTIDAEVPDSMPPTATRSATIAVTDLALTSAQGAAQGWRGGAITIEFNDLTSGGGQVVYGTTNIGDCIVTKFDATHPPNPTVDAGPVTISGSGLLKPVGPCAYTAGIGYLCTDSADVGQDVTVTPTGLNGAAVYSFTGKDFSAKDYVGSYLNVNGLASAGNNSGVSAFPIVGQTGQHSLTVINPGAAAETATAAGIYGVLNGVGPIPTASGANGDFLGVQTTSVRIQKAADADWGAIDFSVYTRGEGFALATTSAQPEQFPSNADNPLVFTCTGDGNCGANSVDAPVQAFIVSGKTTDADITGLPDFIMPPGTTYATFQCGFLISDSATMSVGAIQAILDTNPTRIETRVLRVAGNKIDDPNDDLNKSNVVVGHALVGHTTL